MKTGQVEDKMEQEIFFAPIIGGAAAQSLISPPLDSDTSFLWQFCNCQCIHWQFWQCRDSKRMGSKKITAG